MKRTISVWACLVIIATTPLVAKDSVATIIIKDLATLINTDLATIAPVPNAEKTRLLMIPDVTLNLHSDEKAGLLRVNLEGEISGKLNWVIFQPNIGVVSRISTNSKIDKIKIENLKSGCYILMIKDDQGRALFEKFNISQS